MVEESSSGPDIALQLAPSVTRSVHDHIIVLRRISSHLGDRDIDAREGNIIAGAVPVRAARSSVGSPRLSLTTGAHAYACSNRKRGLEPFLLLRRR